MSGDLISRSALIEEYEWLKSQVSSYAVAEVEENIERINRAPAVEAEPVVHARWRWGRNSMNQYGAWCSECECGWEDKGDDFDRVQGLVIAHKYCPNCGAHMDEEVADGT